MAQGHAVTELKVTGTGDDRQRHHRRSGRFPINQTDIGRISTGFYRSGWGPPTAPICKWAGPRGALKSFKVTTRFPEFSPEPNPPSNPPPSNPPPPIRSSVGISHRIPTSICKLDRGVKSTRSQGWWRGGEGERVDPGLHCRHDYFLVSD